MKIKRTHPAARIPTRGSAGAGAYDMYADEAATLYPGEQQKIALGVHIEIPPGYLALLLPRSGTGSAGMHLANVIGVLDSDYRGCIIANIKNNGSDAMHIRQGDRICQMAIVPVLTPELEVVDELSETARGDGGFGSSGK